MSILTLKYSTLPLIIVFIMQLINDPIDDEQKVRNLEIFFLKALAEKDSQRFSELTHPDFEMIYLSSIRDTKDEILKRWTTAKSQTRQRFYTREVTVQTRSEDEILMEGIKVMEVTVNSQKIIVSSKYRDIYRKDGDDWKVFRAYQLPSE